MWFYAFLPVAVAALGAVWTTLRRPSPPVIGAIQHFAAGVIFYAASGELLPDMMHQGSLWPIVAGGGAGIAAMLALRRLTADAVGPRGLIAAAAIDSLIDGLVLGLGFGAGQQQGILLGIALAIEFLFLGLSIAGAFRAGTSIRTVIFTTVAIALFVPAGVWGAQPIAALPATWQAAAFAFGLVALLYLVTEELLTEAHERPETSWGVAMFFIGFLALAVIGKIMAAD